MSINLEKAMIGALILVLLSFTPQLTGCTEGASEDDAIQSTASGSAPTDTLDVAEVEGDLGGDEARVDDPEGGNGAVPWSIEGLGVGNALSLKAGQESVLSVRFTLQQDCYYNDVEPLSVFVSEAPKNIRVEPAEYIFEAPGDIPEDIQFAISGIEEGAAGEISFDVTSIYCSTEGFCLRWQDTIDIAYEGVSSEAPSSYVLIYPLTIDV